MLKKFTVLLSCIICFRDVPSQYVQSVNYGQQLATNAAAAAVASASDAAPQYFLYSFPTRVPAYPPQAVADTSSSYTQIIAPVWLL